MDQRAYGVSVLAAAAAMFAGVYTLAPPNLMSSPRLQLQPQAQAQGQTQFQAPPQFQSPPQAQPRIRLRSQPPLRLRPQPRPRSQAQPTSTTDSVYYSGCNAVRAAGAAPLYRGQPGYRGEMDGDHDGIACEPYRGRF